MNFGAIFRHFVTHRRGYHYGPPLRLSRRAARLLPARLFRPAPRAPAPRPRLAGAGRGEAGAGL